MISRLRKAFVLLFTLLLMLAGVFGWSGSSGSMPSASAYQGSHAPSYHLFADVSRHAHCPPPPYECF